MKRTLWLILGAVVVLLAAAVLVLAQGGVAGWNLARFGLPFGKAPAPLSAAPVSLASLVESRPAQEISPTPSQPGAASLAPQAAPAPTEPRPAAAKPHRRPVDRTSAAYICAHGDPTNSRTIAACDRKDWAATERATH